jgi:hypothetical protein
MSTTVEAPKKHITQLTAESKEFWRPLFNHMELPEFQFSAKIGYTGKEFESEGLGKIQCVRFFRNELQNGDIYFELYNFDNSFYHESSRKLYRLRHNPNWEKDTTNYKKVVHPTFETYAVKMSDFELVNETDIKALFPEFVAASAVGTPTKIRSFVNSDEGPKESPSAIVQEELPLPVVTAKAMFEEYEDANANQMTMRDYYCMLQNVPLSNKRWLNELINEGRKCQK